MQLVIEIDKDNEIDVIEYARAQRLTPEEWARRVIFGKTKAEHETFSAGSGEDQEDNQYPYRPTLPKMPR